MTTLRLLSTVLCEDVLFDLDRNLTVYRIFRRVSAARFPAMMRRLHIVTTWLGDGALVQRVLILTPDKSEVLYDCTGNVSLAGPLPVPYVNRANWLLWPEPGVYWLRVLSGTQPIDSDIPIVVEATAAAEAQLVNGEST
jgi:hypothetical protein